MSPVSRSGEDGGFLPPWPIAPATGPATGGAGVWCWRVGSDRLEWWRNLEAVHGVPAGTFDGTLAGFHRDIHPDDFDDVWQQVETSAATGAPCLAVYRLAPRPGRDELWVEASGVVTTDPDGTRYLTGICHDVTGRVRDEQLLRRRVMQQDAIARFGSFALTETVLQEVLDEAVRVAADVLDVPLAKILKLADAADHLDLRAGIGWAAGLVGQGEVGIDSESQAGHTLTADGPVIVADLLTETRFNGPALLHDHQVRSGVSVVIPGVQGRPFGVFGIHAREVRAFDDTDALFLQSMANIVAGAARQAAALEHRTLLVREMAHRAGNMLQLVSSIASQTFRPEADSRVARSAFSERLNALARSNHVVARGGWTATPVADIVAETLKPLGPRVTAEGRDVLLPPELSFDLGLVLHELAANSVKYGALGRDDGTVRVTWTVQPGEGGARKFCLEWEDPLPAAEPPQTAKGFGSRMLDALIAGKWNGVVVRDDAPTYRVKMQIPVPD